MGEHSPQGTSKPTRRWRISLVWSCGLTRSPITEVLTLRAVSPVDGWPPRNNYNGNSFDDWMIGCDVPLDVASDPSSAPVTHMVISVAIGNVMAKLRRPYQYYRRWITIKTVKKITITRWGAKKVQETHDLDLAQWLLTDQSTKCAMSWLPQRSPGTSSSLYETYVHSYPLLLSEYRC
jgi:hypothetical protein